MRSPEAPILSPGRIALVYLAFGSLALVFSDVVLVRVIEDPNRLRTLQAMKGAAEVVLTAGLIYGLVVVYRRSLDRQRQETERARDRFAFLNSLLRHHVLNRMNVVQGHVWELQRGAEADEDRLETIQSQSAAVVDLIENVRTLSRRPGEGYERHRLDLSDMVAEAVEAARDEYPEAEIRASIPPEVHVEADESLSLVFENLLHNAIEHNDADVPTVRVTVDAGGDPIVTRVTDNGPGISADALSEEADRRGHEGLGLLLVRTLVDRYDGDVWIEEGDGGTVAIELPRADSPERRGD